MKFIYYKILLVISFWSYANAAKVKDEIPIHETFRINSTKVGEERTINVWIPEEYKKKPFAIPVMYMLDGGIKEDFPHVVKTVSRLIKSNKIPPVLVVGIENTQRRRDLTGFTDVAKDKEIAPVVGGSIYFRAFIKEELFPEIEKRYKVSGKRALIGESLAGLFVVETLFLSPEMFNYYIAFDPSLWWNNHYLVTSAKDNLDKLSNKEAKFWFASSNALDISVNCKELSNVLKNNTVKGLEWIYLEEPREKHATIFKATKEKALFWSLEKININQ